MTAETFENLRRVQDCRRMQGAKTGNWKAVREAIVQIVRLEREYHATVNQTSNPMTTQSPDQSLSQSPKGLVESYREHLEAAMTLGELPSATDVPYLTDLLGEVYLDIVEASRSLTQSPAPSKEMEENLQRMRNAMETLDQQARPLASQWRIHAWTLMTLAESIAAELGKEREAGLDALINQWSETNNSLERDNETLKRELAEAQKWKDLWSAAQDELASSDSDKNAYREAMEKAHAKLAEAEKRETELHQWARTRIDEAEAKSLALSLAYQRQKDALWKAKAKLACGYSESANEILINALLAETPDVSLLERVVGELSEIDKQIASLFWTSDDGDNLRDGKPEDADAPEAFCKAWQSIRALLSALERESYEETVQD